MRLCHVSSNNFKNTNHKFVFLTETGHWKTKLSKTLQFVKNNNSVYSVYFATSSRKLMKKYISGIVWVSKSKL